MTLQYFRDLLKDLLEAEVQFEKYREEIGEEKESLFESLDKDGKGHLNENDLRNFFEANEVYPTA